MTVYRLRREGYIAILRWWGRLTGHLPRQGIGRLATALSFLVPEGATSEVAAGDGQMRLPTADPYYAGLIGQSRRYEPELEHLIRRSLAFISAFVDGGANFGYWSIYVSSALNPDRRVIAIEANARNFDFLKANCELNGSLFIPVHAALSDSDGYSATIDTHDMARHAIGRVRLSSKAGECPTIMVDTVLEKYSIPAESCLIKLDIEGFEQRALSGATESILNGSVVVYEDHGKDQRCLATASALQAGLAVYLLDENGLVPIEAVEDLVRRKKSRIRGYNCLTARKDSKLLLEILTSAPTNL